MTPTACPPPRRRLPLWARVLLWTSAAVVALVGAGLLWLAAMLSGGLDDVLSGSAPSEDDPQVVEARADAARALERQAAGLVSTVAGSTALATGAGGTCTEGQHNWKIDDDFDLRCDAVRATVVPGGRVGGFRAAALEMHERLVAAGWQPSGVSRGLPERSSIAWVVGEYWDERATLDDPGDPYDPADLPAAAYVRDDVALTVQWLTEENGRLSVYPVDVLRLEDGGTVPPDAAGRIVPAGQYATVLVVGKESFRA